MTQHDTLTIAIDLDETLAWTFEKVFDFGCKKFGWDMPYENAIIMHDWWKIPSLGLTEKWAFKLFDEYFLSDPNDSLIPTINGAKKGVTKLRSMGNNCHIITARTESIRKAATKSWLKENMPEFDFSTQVHFTNHYEPTGSRTKGEVCRQIGAQILIDDNLEFLQSASSLGIFCILLDKPWNKSEIMSKNITRVTHWDEIPRLIDDHKRNSYFNNTLNLWV